MSVLFVWKKDYETGCPTIDKQHRHLFEIVNEFFDAFESANADEKLPHILDELEKYTIYHFSTEEKLFAEKNYPYTDEHKTQHQYFVNKVKEFKAEYEKGGNTLLIYDLMLSLKDWLFDHVLGSDRKYIPYLCKNQ